MYFNTNKKLNNRVDAKALLEQIITDLESKKDLEKYPEYIAAIHEILHASLDLTIIDRLETQFLLADLINVIAKDNIKVNAKYALFLQDLHNNLYTEEVVTFAKYEFITSGKLDRTFKVNVTSIDRKFDSLKDEMIFILKKNGITELCYIAKNIVEYLNFSGRNDD